MIDDFGLINLRCAKANHSHWKWYYLILNLLNDMSMSMQTIFASWSLTALTHRQTWADLFDESESNLNAITIWFHVENSLYIIRIDMQISCLNEACDNSLGFWL